MAWTQSDLDALDLALTNGRKRVIYADGRSIEYHSLDEMRRLRKDMKGELEAAASTVNPRRVTVARFRSLR